MNYVGAAIAQGLNVALFQWCSYEGDVRKPLNPAIRQMAQAGQTRHRSPWGKSESFNRYRWLSNNFAAQG